MSPTLGEVGQAWQSMGSANRIRFMHSFQTVIDYIKKKPTLLFQNFAENTMNELLGWYGYDKVELKDGEDIEFRSYPTDGESRQHISVLKGNDI